MIEREIEKGMVKRVNSDLTITYRYSADRGQDVYDLNTTTKGPKVKLKSSHLKSQPNQHILDYFLQLKVLLGFLW